MYICICNALNERQVHGALQNGARTAGQVYAGLGCAPRCGKCVPTVREMVRALIPGPGRTELVPAE
jgi:bacterioferritin-associated ferredoxin